MPDDGSNGTGLSGALEEADGLSDGPVDGAIEPCPDDPIRVVELVEVVTHNANTTTQPADSRDQYINLDDQADAANPHPGFGRAVRLKARVEWVSGDPNRSLAGKTVYWYVTADGNNRAGLAGDELPGFAAAGTNVLQTTAPTGQDGWTTVVEFYLSLYGGDAFTVSATEDDSYQGGLSAGPYTVWRKFWYQVTEMMGEDGVLLDLPADVTNPFEAAYEAVFMRFEEQGPRTQANHVANLPAHVDRMNESSPHFVNDDLVPFKLHVMTIDFACEPDEVEITDLMTAATYQTDAHFLWDRGPDTHPWKISAQYRRATGVVWHCRRTDPPCPGHGSRDQSCPPDSGTGWTCNADGCPGHEGKHQTCTGGVWHCRCAQPPCPGHSSQSHFCVTEAGQVWLCGEDHCSGHAQRHETCSLDPTWHDIPDDKMRTIPDASRRGFKQIEIDFSAGPLVPSASLNVEIKLEIKKFDGVVLGWGGGATTIFMCTGTQHDWFAAGDWDPVQRGVLVHEGGHALGLVNMTPSPANAHDAWAAPGNVHHCSKLPADCTMYFTATTAGVTTFHLDGGVGCHDALRRQDYSRGQMAHWTP